ncbi:hypothetical protein MRBLMN1_004597 [Chitinophaga ginsengisegetis]|uniref:hypothetical protein n=1 Tax=Chitinophaga ginsengisegetis TaxID=393003 RepID=UPI00343A5598
MKQAKLALTAVAVLAVVGGALAFKARTVQTPIYTEKASLGTIYCSVATTTNGVDDENAPGATFTVKASLAPKTLPGTCPVITLHRDF